MNTTFLLSSNSRSTAGVLLLTIVAIEYGGWFMLRIVRGRQPVTPFQRACFRAGHAHAGVLVILALVGQILADAAQMSGDRVSHPGKFAIDLDIESGQLVGTTALYDWEGVYSVRQFVTYEKELRLADEECDCPCDSVETLIGV